MMINTVYDDAFRLLHIIGVFKSCNSSPDSTFKLNSSDDYVRCFQSV